MATSTPAPTKRRTRRHFGGIRKLPSGKYQATYWRDGQQHAQTFATSTTLKEVREYLSAVETDILREQWADPRAGSVTFKAYAEEWLDTGVKRERIRPTTEAKYRGLLDRHLLPIFGNRQLSKIAAGQIQTWYDDLAPKHPSTAASAYRLLATIFNRAVKDHKVPRSPCDVEGGSSDPAERRPIASVAECQKAINSIPEHYQKYQCAIMLAAWGQLRRGEVLALRRGDIDIEDGTVNIERAWLVTERGKTILGEPKTRAGMRTLHLPSHVLIALTSHLHQYVGAENDAWLFPGSHNQPLHPRTFARVWTKAREAIGRTDLTFHDLRHSGLTWVGEAGATEAELMHRGGHASPAAARRYWHAAAERDRALAEQLARMSQAT